MNMKDKFQLKSCWSKRLIFKIRLKLVNGRSRSYKNVNEINRLNALVNWNISLSFVRKHLYSIKDIIAVTAYVIVDVLSLSRPLQQQPYFNVLFW